MSDPSVPKIPRALTIQDLYSKKRDVLHFTGAMFDAIGHPEITGSWIVWAGSGHGKTSGALFLAKYLTKFGKVIYNSVEEGESESFKLACMDMKMEEVKDHFLFLDKEPVEILRLRLKRHKAPRFVIIDSLQYVELTLKSYKALQKEFPKVLFIYISHADGKEPQGLFAKKVRYDAMVKIFIQGFVAFCSSRYKRGASKPLVIVESKALEYWGDIPESSNLK